MKLNTIQTSINNLYKYINNNNKDNNINYKDNCVSLFLNNITNNDTLNSIN